MRVGLQRTLQFIGHKYNNVCLQFRVVLAYRLQSAFPSTCSAAYDRER